MPPGPGQMFRHCFVSTQFTDRQRARHRSLASAITSVSNSVIMCSRSSPLQRQARPPSPAQLSQWRSSKGCRDYLEPYGFILFSPMEWASNKSPCWLRSALLILFGIEARQAKEAHLSELLASSARYLCLSFKVDRRNQPTRNRYDDLAVVLDEVRTRSNEFYDCVHLAHPRMN